RDRGNAAERRHQAVANRVDAREVFAPGSRSLARQVEIDRRIGPLVSLHGMLHDRYLDSAITVLVVDLGPHVLEGVQHRFELPWAPGDHTDVPLVVGPPRTFVMVTL